MCIKKYVEETTYGSTIEYQDRLWVVNNGFHTNHTVSVTEKHGSKTLEIPFGVQVVSHYLGPVERRRLRFPKCELPLERQQ